MKNPTYLFHYTSGARVNDIIKSGELKVSKAYLQQGERPTLWLSSEPIWDNSALKFINFKNKEEQHKDIGLGRVVVPFINHFVTYGKWKHVSGVNPFFESMEVLAFPDYDRGKWWASFKNIPIKDFLSIEIWDGDKWCYHDSNTPSKYTAFFANNNL